MPVPPPPRRASTAPVRRRHLLDPADLHRSHLATQSSEGSLSRVQQWVMSVLAVVTLLHFAAGLAIAAIFVDAHETTARIGLNVLASVVGVLAVAAGFGIHRRRPLTGWLVLGIAPGLVGAWLTFR